MKRLLPLLVLLLVLLLGSPAFAVSCFWVGGAGGGNISDATKWSNASGGAGSLCAGAGGLPDATIDVFINGSSGAGTMTWDASQSWKSLDMTGSATNITHNTLVSITIGATGTTGIKFAGSGTYTPATATSQIIAITTNNVATNFTSNGFSFAALTFNAATGNWVLQDTLNVTAIVSAAITHTAGTLNTNAQTVNASTFTGTGSSTRTLNITNSTINITSTNATTVWNFSTITGLTFTVTGSTINFTGSTATNQRLVAFGALTYNVINITGTGNFNLASGGSPPTIGTLTRNGTLNTDVTAFGNNVTVSGTLTLSGASQVNRMKVQSGTLGTNRTITAAVVALSNIDISNITGAGVASPFTGTSLGDMTANTNITFTAPVTRYKIGGSGNFSDIAIWSATSNGAGGATMPLPQDTAIINQFSFSATGQTLTSDVPRISAMDWSTVTNNPTFTIGSLSLVGSLTFSASMTITAANTFVYQNQGTTVTITSNGALVPPGLTIQSIGGTISLADAFNTGPSSGSISQTNGTLTTNSNTVTLRSAYVSSGSSARTLNMGNSLFNVTAISGTPWSVTGSNFTVTYGSSAMIRLLGISAVVGGRSIAAGGLSWPHLSIADLDNTFTNTITGGGSFRSISMPPGGTVARVFQIATTTTVTSDAVSLNGSAAFPITIKSNASGVATNFVSRTGRPFTFDYTTIQDITASGGTPWIACNSTDGTGNTNITFNPASCSGLKPAFLPGKQSSLVPANDNDPLTAYEKAA